MLTALFIALAGIFKAVADVLNHKYHDSIFRNLNVKFWMKDESWKHAKKIPFTNYPVDGWHLANSGMITCFCLACALHAKSIDWYWEVLIAGGVFNLSFNLFYNKILRK